MKVKVIAGGSGGNAVVVEHNGKLILMDCGLPKTKIEKALIDNGFSPTDIKAIFITHAHGDHVAGIGMATKYSIPVFASEGSWKNEKYMSLVSEELRKKIMHGESTYIDDFYVQAFETHHDDYQCLGFTVCLGLTQLAVCMDTSHVTDEMIEAMRGSDIYIIESNHDFDMLMTGPYHEDLKDRIDKTHLNNAQVADAMSKLITGKGERIILTHLSKTNNTPELAMKAVIDALEQEEKEEGIDYCLEVVG